MAPRTTGNAQLDELVSQLRKLGKHQYAQVVAAASESRSGTTARRAVLSTTMPRVMFADLDEVKHPAVFLTVKTTGHDYENDEVIGVSAVDENGVVLMDAKFRPANKRVWYQKRSDLSHITPADVFDDDEVKPIRDSAHEIEKILGSAESVIGWNLHYQLDMLHTGGIDIYPQRKYIDLSKALYKDKRKKNKNRRRAFDDKAQEKFEHAIRDNLGESYSAAKPLDDVLYLMRIWKAAFPDLQDDQDDIPF